MSEARATGPTFHLIPHVHWDREWYLTRSAFTARLVPMMDRLLDLLESAPSLRWHLDGQMILVEDYLSIVPGARGTIEALVRRGQLAIGPWYVLSDELIPSGVSLAKNLEIGIAMARELGGESPVLYSPDAFGHPAGLPSLAAKFGIPWAAVWRGLGAVNGREHDLYRWRDEDQSVLTYHFPPQGYEAGIGLAHAGGRLAGEWGPLRAQLLARSVTSEIAVPVGADHHAAEPKLATLAERLQAIESNAQVRFSSWPEYFRAVEQRKPEAPEVRGELRNSRGYVWSLQGVHSTRARLKRRYSAAENLLVTASSLAKGPVVQWAWRELVQAQFHDTIAGCCADAVAAEQEVRVNGVVASASDALERAIFQAVGHDPDEARAHPGPARSALVVWNPDRRAFDGVVMAETTWFDRDVLVGPPGHREPREGLGYRTFHLTGPGGIEIPVQVLRVQPGLERIDAPRHYPDLDQVDRVWVAAWLGSVGGRQTLRYDVAEGAGPVIEVPNPVATEGGVLDNGLVSVAVDGAGLVRITDHETRAEYPGLLAVTSESDAGDLYTPDIQAGTERRARTLATRLLASGPLIGGFETRWVLSPASGGVVHGRTVVWLEAGRPQARVRIEFDNWACDHRLRTVLPLGRLGRVLAGAPFGSERRPAGALDRSWPEEASLPTDPAHGFVESVDPATPFRLEHPGFFEYELALDGTLSLTLCRSVGELSRPDGANRRGHAGWAMPTPAAQEPGRHAVEFGIAARAGGRPQPVIPMWVRRFAADPVRARRRG